MLNWFKKKKKFTFYVIDDEEDITEIFAQQIELLYPHITESIAL